MKSEESQVNTLIYSMGQKADDILQSLQLSADDEKKYDTLKEKFESCFIHQYSNVPSSIYRNKGKLNPWTVS